MKEPKKDAHVNRTDLSYVDEHSENDPKKFRIDFD